MALKFKICTLDNLSELSKISKRTFKEAFEDLNKPTDFKAYLTKAFSKSQLKIELQNKNSFFYFVYLDSELTGYYKLNYKIAQNEFRDQNSIEMERIYILKNYQGQKIGQSIIYGVISKAKLEKIDFIWLGVWKKKQKCNSFLCEMWFQKGRKPSLFYW